VKGVRGGGRGNLRRGRETRGLGGAGRGDKRGGGGGEWTRGLEGGWKGGAYVMGRTAWVYELSKQDRAKTK